MSQSARTDKPSPPIAGFLLVALCAVPVTAFGEEEPSAGREAFLGNKCNMCHSISSQDIERTSTSDKMKAEDLSAVGDERDAEWIVKFLQKEVERDGEEHKRSYKGTEEELAAIGEWLSTLKSDAAE